MNQQNKKLVLLIKEELERQSSENRYDAPFISDFGKDGHVTFDGNMDINELADAILRVQ